MQTFTSITMVAIGSVASAWDDSRTARGGSPSALVCEHLETSGLSRGRVERVMGIEPTLAAWEGPRHVSEISKITEYSIC